MKKIEDPNEPFFVHPNKEELDASAKEAYAIHNPEVVDFHFSYGPGATPENITSLIEKMAEENKLIAEMTEEEKDFVNYNAFVKGDVKRHIDMLDDFLAGNEFQKSLQDLKNYGYLHGGVLSARAILKSLRIRLDPDKKIGVVTFEEAKERYESINHIAQAFSPNDMKWAFELWGGRMHLKTPIRNLFWCEAFVDGFHDDLAKYAKENYSK